MKPSFHLRLTTRRRLAWLVVVMLLWQQVAVAAYACGSAPMSSGTTMAQMHSSSLPVMSDDCGDVPDASASPTCHQHCQPERAAKVAVPTSSVPPNTLVALPPMLLSTAITIAPSNHAMAQSGHLYPWSPPPTLLFCSLLI
ncbi:MAG: hypothetical protein ABI128_01220 [Rhodanobacter sp.]